MMDEVEVAIAALMCKDVVYKKWKSNVRFVYDCFTNHKLVWPSLSCRWGSQFEQGTYKNRQRLYLAEQTDGSVPNTLIITNCDVVKPGVAIADDISQFNEEAQSPFVERYKTLLHPGEVNRIRELPQNSNIVATHTDSPDVFIWDMEAQPNLDPVNGAAMSRPDLILTGHRENAEFALAMCPTEPFVLSGGQDKSVVLWSIHDYITSLGLTESGSSSDITKDSPKLDSRGVFEGHDATVEDVQFCPSSAQEFCSVGDDSCLILWDVRSGNSPVVKVEKAHDDDLHCVDWNAQDVNLILTGSADKTVRLFDRRKLTAGGVASPVRKFEGHMAPLFSIQWCPDKASVFASAADDGFLNIWDHDTVGIHENARGKKNPSLFFPHGGHRDRIMDFHWNPAEPWTLASLSHDVTSPYGGGTLQIWRMRDQLYRPEEELEAELIQHKENMKTFGLRAKSKRSKKRSKKSSK
ncbi:WD-40 repeat-containing protein MSI4-like [Carex rostrata]